jgi:aspartyl/asparaginyl beta-hydroxylase (cupin superfamily)
VTKRLKEQDRQSGFFDYRQVYPFLEALKDSHDILVQEMEQIRQEAWLDWPEKNLYGTDRIWNVFPLLGFGKEISTNCQRCPKTVQLLRKFPGLRTALYSRLGPNCRLGVHQGWAVLSNHVLRSHYGLQVPEQCGLWVDGQYKTQSRGGILLFDDSRIHTAMNHSNEDRIILIVDIERPSWVPQGRSKQEVTGELAELLRKFGVMPEGLIA